MHGKLAHWSIPLGTLVLEFTLGYWLFHENPGAKWRLLLYTFRWRFVCVHSQQQWIEKTVVSWSGGCDLIINIIHWQSVMTTNNQSSKHLNNEDDKKTIKASIAVRDLNDLLSCRLCKGYLIDATTIVECLHSCMFTFNLNFKSRKWCVRFLSLHFLFTSSL